MFIEIINFIIYSALIVLIAKYILVWSLRNLAEVLNLKPKTVGDIAGYATSTPEFLTITASALNGLISASIINVLSSNIINLVQYFISIYLNNNQKAFRNKAIIVDIVLVIITVLIPIVLIFFNIEISIFLVPFFVVLYFLFIFLNGNVHKLYLKKEDNLLENNIKNESDKINNKPFKILLYVIYLILTGILLFIIGNLLGTTLEVLCIKFSISQTIIGILLGLITSIPELITFIESQKHYKKQTSNDILGVVEATNNLFTSNVLNLFVIQTIGIIIFSIVS
ncbi:MAG: hypothetical protein HUJ68_08400 [Clostridia bacterium]|nr:hypothetical protein [Clostridia bacterium]